MTKSGQGMDNKLDTSLILGEEANYQKSDGYKVVYRLNTSLKTLGEPFSLSSLTMDKTVTIRTVPTTRDSRVNSELTE